ncbi:MAG: MraY family glycosyltransferase [Parcubacteria group bacterium]
MAVSNFIIALSISFVVGLAFTPPVIWLAKKLSVIDQPVGGRHIHKKPTPLLGGLAIFLGFNAVAFAYAFFTDNLTGDTIIFKNLLGIFFGCLFLVIGGFLDDKYRLKPWQAMIFPVLASVSVIMCGVGISWITNLAGDGLWRLDLWSLRLFWYHGFPYNITLPADIFTFIWLLGMIYTTKLLDGLDGLVSGVTVIGAAFIFFVALNKGEIVQYDVALLATILAGVFFGFLVFNFNPASIFLGEGGSTLAGFLLGSISIISGSKVGITMLLLSIPILDVAWTVARRLFGRQALSLADKKHLHFRLLDAGFDMKRAVLLLYSVAVIFGLLAYFMQDQSGSLLILGLLALIVFVALLLLISRRQKARA